MIQWLTKDPGLKIISLILAIGLWYYALGEEGIEVTRAIPLNIELKSEQMSILKKSAQSVNVTMVAPRSSLSQMTLEVITARHIIGPDVKTAGEYSFRLQPGEIKLPSPYIRVTQIAPEVVRVTLDELILKKLEIRADFSGDPAFGYKVNKEELQLDPNAIMLEGPKGELEKLDYVQTQPIDLVGRIRSFRRTVGLNHPSNVRPLGEALVDVFVPIQEEFEEKTLENVSVKILRDPDSQRLVELNPPIITFTVKGSKRLLEKLAPENTMAYLDTSRLEPGEHDLPVEVVLPEGVSLKNPETVRVHVSINKK